MLLATLSILRNAIFNLPGIIVSCLRFENINRSTTHNITGDSEFYRYRNRIFDEYRLTVRLNGTDRYLYNYSMMVDPLPVICEDGQTYHVPWLGFILREETQLIPGEYAKLKVLHIDRGVSIKQRQTLRKGEFVQGWLVSNGIYAVTDNVVAVVSSTESG